MIQLDLALLIFFSHFESIGKKQEGLVWPLGSWCSAEQVWSWTSACICSSHRWTPIIHPGRCGAGSAWGRTDCVDCCCGVGRGSTDACRARSCRSLRQLMGWHLAALARRWATFHSSVRVQQQLMRCLLCCQG